MLFLDATIGTTFFRIFLTIAIVVANDDRRQSFSPSLPLEYFPKGPQGGDQPSLLPLFKPTVHHISTPRFLSFRESEHARLLSSPSLTLGDVTTVNLTIMEGGVQVNVVPDRSGGWSPSPLLRFELTFDIRLHPGTDVPGFEAMVRYTTLLCDISLSITNNIEFSLFSIACSTGLYFTS